MPGPWQVRLSEALAIQGRRLDEQQIWAILSQAVQTLQDCLSRGEIVGDGEPTFIITPDTLFVCRGGNIEYGKITIDAIKNQDFIPPEMDTLQHTNMTEIDIEKMCVFSLGLTIYWGADYKLGTDQELELSELLDQVLSAMCEEDPHLRVNLKKLNEVCLEHRQKHPDHPPDSYFIRNLYMLLMGSSSDLDEIERNQRRCSANSRSRSRPRSHHRSHTRSRSRSRSRSRDRRSRRSPQRKRPHPVGRDHTLDDPYLDHVPAYAYNKHYPPPPAPYATVLPNQDYAYPYYSGYVGNIPTTQRRVLAEIQPDSYSPMFKDGGVSRLPPGVIPPPEPWAAPAVVYPDHPTAGGTMNQYPAASVKEPIRNQQVEHMYGRLRERSARLQALRQKLEYDDISDMTSLYSDLTDAAPDHKSMLSANSSTHGIFVPDDTRQAVPRPFGEMAQKLDSDWIKQQEAEIEAMIMAQNAFLQENRDAGDGARSDHDVAMGTPHSGSLTKPNQFKAQRSRPKSRESSAGTTRSKGRPQSAKSSERSRSRPRSRPFYGPEFIQDHGIVTLHTPDARTLPPAKVRHLEVVLLNGQKLDVICDVNVITKEVAHTVTSYLNLPEAFYFGLTYVHEGEHFFMESDSPVHKFAPKSWKNQNIGRFILHLRVKFYTDVLSHLQHETTRHLFYLQIRRDLLEDRCWVTTAQATTLCALAVQAEYNDHVLAGKKNWTPDHYFPPRTLRKIGKACARDQVMEKLKQFEGMSERSAEIQFLKEAMLLPEYGIHFYRVHKSKSDSVASLWVGISVQGVLISEQDTTGSRRVICRHAWSDTQKVSYNKRRFSIQPKPDPNVGKLPKLNFFTETYKISRYLTQLCTSHHRFQMMSRISLHGPMTGFNVEDFDENNDDRYNSQSIGSGDSPHDPNTDDEFTEADSIEPEPPQSRQHSRPSSGMQRPPLAANTNHSHATHRPQEDVENIQPKNSTRCTSPTDRPSSSSSAHVIDIIDTSVVPMSEVVDGDDITIYKTKARKLEIVRLQKDPRHGYGITIVGGNNIGKLDFGVFIQSVTPGSPADVCQKIHPGDRVLAINGQSLEGMPHSMAVELIQESPGVIELTLSQLNRNLGVGLELGHSDESLNVASPEHNLVITSSEVHHSAERGKHHQQKYGNVPHLPSSVDSSDLELEDILPPEAMPSTAMHHTQNIDCANGDTNEDGSEEELTSYQNNTNSSNHRPTSGFSNQSQDMPTNQSASSMQLKPGDLYELVLQKKQGSFGLNITGGINTSVKHGGIYVKSLTKDGAADQDGRISVGDRVIEVNGVSLMKVTHRQAVETLRSAPTVCKLVLEKAAPPSRQAHQHVMVTSASSPVSETASPTSFCEGNSTQLHEGVTVSMAGSTITPQVSLSPHNFSNTSVAPSGGKDLLMEFYPFVTKDNLLEIQLHKWSSGLGFSVLGGIDVHPDPLRQVVRIKKIFPTGPAAHQGELKEGDVILEVNDTMTRGLKHQEVMNLLRMAPEEVTLLVCRPSEMDLPQIESVTKELELLGTTSPIPVVNTDALQGPATYSDIDDACSQSVSTHYTHDAGSVTDQSCQEQSVRSQTPQAENEEEEEVQPEDKEVEALEENANKSVTDVHDLSPIPTPVTDFLHNAGLSDDDIPTENRTNKSDTEILKDESDNEEDGKEYEVTLTKGEKGLGFTVAGSHHISGYFYVKDVLFDPALSCGKIKSGHRLIVVDDQDMTGFTHREAVAYLRQTPSVVTLRFYIPSAEERAIAEAKATITKDAINTGNSPQCTSTPRHSVDTALQQTTTKQADVKPENPPHRATDPKNVQEENLNKSNNSSTSGGDSPSSSSFGEQSLPMPNDQNEEFSLEKSKVDKTSSSTEQPGVFRVTLKRQNNGYGFSLIQGERGISSALFVRTITPGGAADRDGKLCVGDRLLQVNGESVIGMAHNKAISYIKNSKDYVQLTVIRNSPHSGHCSDLDQSKSTTELQSTQNISELSKYSASSPVLSGNIKRPELGQEKCNEDVTPESRLSQEGQQAFLRLIEKQKQEKSESDSDDSWGQTADSSAEDGDLEEEEKEDDNSPPKKPPRKKQFSRLPEEISDNWLESLPLVKPPADTVHYGGKQLQTLIKQLCVRLDNDDPLEEYKVLKHAKLTDNCLEARKTENKSKNRYRNVLPYDANRVKLSGPEDYINASHISASVGQDRLSYIASQGPLPNTTGDFWRMVWEQQVEVITMVTRDVEDNKVKCHKYWPDSVTEPFTVWDRYEISLLQVHHLQHFDIRQIKMEDRHTGKVHRVVHLAFNTWPDQGVPLSAIPLIRYIQFARLVHQTGPVLVHCSAGIGRTGVLITIDIILAMINRDIKFDIQKIVQDLRRQRQGVIQVKDQYKFCYLAALQALQSIT